jgi:hypothetical protein
MIQVFETGESKDLSRLTPPFHFVPNPRYLEGWHFRNADNTGPNSSGAKNVNSPPRIREFVFSPEVANMNGKPTTADISRVGQFGRGQLEILDFGLTGLRRGERASFTWLRFRVTLRWS